MVLSPATDHQLRRGTADVNGAMYLWNRDAFTNCNENDPWIPREDGIKMENRASCGGSSLDAFDHNRPICNARALWDIVDNPLGDDDDSQGHDLTSLWNVLDWYPHNMCFNHSANESDPYTPCLFDPNGNNWKDFKYNWVDRFGAGLGSLNAMEAANGLAAQDDF